MYPRLIFALFLFYSYNSLFAQEVKSKLNREKFYSVISSDDLNKVDDQLRSLEELTIPEKEGFTGALLMKKAGLLKNVKNKIKLFKEGNHKLEDAIEKDSLNIEYRFLRLIIQENAPDILNYHKDLKKDSTFIKENYKNLPLVVRQAIEDYSKKSKVLKLN
jgi:hypothetical protein